MIFINIKIVLPFLFLDKKKGKTTRSSFCLFDLLIRKKGKRRAARYYCGDCRGIFFSITLVVELQITRGSVRSFVLLAG